MQRSATPVWASWVVNHGDPPGGLRMLDRPRRAVVAAPTYGGWTVRLQLFVVATAPGWVCVQQDLAGRAPWNAWVPSASALPV
jgi:hypothetical protein